MCDLCSQIGLNSDFTLHDVPFQNIRLSILQNAISNQVQYAMYNCISIRCILSRIVSTTVQPFLSCWLTHCIQPAPRSMFSHSYLESTINPAPGDLNTDQLSFCRYFYSLTFLQGWHLCVQLLGASQDDVFDVSMGSKSFGLNYIISWVQRLKFFKFQLTPLHMKQTR